MSYQTAAVTVSAANTSRDASGSNVYELYEALQACYVGRAIFQPLGANAATAARIFVNNGEPISTAENNKLNAEVTVPLVSAATETAGLSSTDLTLNIYLKAGQKILVTVGTAPTDGIDVSLAVARNYRDFNV